MVVAAHCRGVDVRLHTSPCNASRAFGRTQEAHFVLPSQSCELLTGSMTDGTLTAQIVSDERSSHVYMAKEYAISVPVSHLEYCSPLQLILAFISISFQTTIM